MISNKESLTIKEVAAMNGISEKVVRSAIKRRQLEAYHFGSRCVRISDHAVQAWRDECRRRAWAVRDVKAPTDVTG